MSESWLHTRERRHTLPGPKYPGGDQKSQTDVLPCIIKRPFAREIVLEYLIFLECYLALIQGNDHFSVSCLFCDSKAAQRIGMHCKQLACQAGNDGISSVAEQA